MTAAELGTVRVRSTLAAPAPRVLRRAFGIGVTVAAAVVLLALGLYCAGWLTGHHALVDRGDSMRPALSSGDLVINRSIPAERIRVGDIVTFEDRPRRRSITHRVVRRAGAGSRLDFVTRGDANSGFERWSARRGEELGRLVASVPRAGYAVGFLTSPLLRLLLTAFCAIALCGLALRWIWRDDPGPEPGSSLRGVRPIQREDTCTSG